MADSTEATMQSIKIAYLMDTLFGVNPLASECRARIMRTASGFQLQLARPWPSQLQQAHTLTFEWEGGTCCGVVRHTEKLPGGELLLDVDPQP
ncbi:hypothetical protein [Pseudomonas sp. 58 R 3]|uniref:hypothetical protein n=1 Tax=Pseudomonas sp. 58 R 3 TaxID=1844108 RepID=UPI000812BB65|nr:hypothetical protein [Pseudomonas sp. 58 R 3]CRM71850.1 hypothetical protein [Pseudomonas sp. 58 R 3]